jgi:hypothetical protein
MEKKSVNSSSDEWVNVPKKFIDRTKDIYSIDAIASKEVHVINANKLLYLFGNLPEMERYARLSMGSVFGLLMGRIASLNPRSAKEK